MIEDLHWSPIRKPTCVGCVVYKLKMWSTAFWASDAVISFLSGLLFLVLTNYREPLDVLIWFSVNSSRSTSLHSIAHRITESTLSLMEPDGPWWTFNASASSRQISLIFLKVSFISFLSNLRSTHIQFGWSDQVGSHALSPLGCRRHVLPVHRCGR